MPAHRGQRDPRRGQLLAGRDQHIPLGEIRSARADMIARHRRPLARKVQGGAITRRLLLDENGIGAGGHGRASEDPRRLVRPERAIEPAPGLALAHHLPRPGQFGEADRIAVHRRQIGRRLGPAGDDILRRMAIDRLYQPDALDRQRRRERQQACLRLGDRQQAHGARQSPDRPPDLAISRISPMRIALSIALAMS